MDIYATNRGTILKGIKKPNWLFEEMKSHYSRNVPSTKIQHGAFFIGEKKSAFFNRSHSTQTNSPSFIRPKLGIRDPNDKSEKEADVVENDLVNKNSCTNSIQRKQVIGIQRKCKECEEEGVLQEKQEGGSMNASSFVSGGINHKGGKGNSLPSKTLTQMNSAFGTDFSGVHIHNDRESVTMSKRLHAQAFTNGSDIYFNAGKYSPDTMTGKQLLAHELTHVIQQRSLEGMISRKIDVPFAKSRPVNSKNPNADSQGNVVEKLLNKLCIEGGIVVSRGNVILPVDLCDLPGPIDGNMALTKAEQSKTKTGCSCLCDLVKSNHVVRIIINDGTEGTTLAAGQDAEKPGVGSGSTVQVPSPDTPRTQLPTKSGKMSPIDHVINLGHELCGHAFFNMRGEARKDHVAQRGRGGHQATVDRENLIRDEQGVERRATFREPFCGEDPGGSFIEECKKWREEFNKINGTNFKIQDTIPVNPFEEKPADFRIEVGFNKDMPLRGVNSANSFNVSVTSKGKEMFGFALAVFQDNPDKKFQLEAHASSDKPAGDPDYNRLLSERRVQLILSQLVKRGIDPKKLEDKKDSGCSSIDKGLKNCSDTEAGAPGNTGDRKVVIRIF